MFTLTRILSLKAPGDASASRDTDIEMTPSLFAVARWLSAFFGRRTIGNAAPPSAVAKNFYVSEGRFWSVDAFNLESVQMSASGHSE